MEQWMPGEKVVILGSGDIGLIMARRMHLEGAEVEAVLEEIAGIVTVANYNSPGQVVISGEVEAVGAAEKSWQKKEPSELFRFQLVGLFIPL
jgi:malonyl CoA-acyl carrier protein transacylase